MKIIARAKECIQTNEQLGEFVMFMMDTVARNEAEKKHTRGMSTYHGICHLFIF